MKSWNQVSVRAAYVGLLLLALTGCSNKKFLEVAGGRTSQPASGNPVPTSSPLPQVANTSPGQVPAVGFPNSSNGSGSGSGSTSTSNGGAKTATARAMGNVHSSDTYVTAEFTTDVPVVIHVNGWAQVGHNAKVVEFSGIEARLSINGTVCGSDLVGQYNASQIVYGASVSCITQLPAGRHLFRIENALAFLPNTMSFSSHLNYIALPVPGDRSPVTDVFEGAAQGPKVSKYFKNTVPVVLRIAGNVESRFSSPVLARAGVRATISIDGVECGSDSAYEETIAERVFKNSASCARLLPPGEHLITVEDNQAGIFPGMREYFSRISYMAVSTEPSAGVIAGSKTKHDSSMTVTFTTPVPIVIQVSGEIQAYSQNRTFEWGGSFTALVIDDEPCGYDNEFETNTKVLYFSSNVVCSRVLTAGTHEIEVRDVVLGLYPNMGYYRSTIQYEGFALP